jgi:alpha-L-rhamnosidase
MVSKGATSIWERWDSDTCGPGMNSEALLIQAGSLGAWFIESLAGITPHPDGPGFMKFNLQPCLTSGLNWLRAEVNTPYGVIVSNWHHEDEKWIWNIIIPPNTTAIIYIPGDDFNAITENGNSINSVPGILKLSGIQNGKCICHLDAGVYCFNVKNAIINNKIPVAL